MKRGLKNLLANVLAVAMVATTVPAMSFTALAQDEGNWKYLDELDWSSAASGWNGTHKNQTVNGTTFTLLDKETGENKEFTRGIGGHAHSEVVYDIEANAISSFESYFGVDVNSDDQHANRGSVQFQVYGDDTLLFQSDVLRATDGMQNTGKIDLSGYKTLRLVGNDGGNGISGDWVEWCDAKVEIDPAILEKLSTLEMSVDRGILPVGEQAQVSAVAKRANGEAIDFSKEGSLTFASSDEDVAAVDANGVITGVGDGIARIKATAELNGVVKENTVVLLVGTGASEDAMAVSSPSNTNSIIFTQNADGGVEYFVTANGKIAMNASATGLDTNLGDFSTGLTYVGREDQVIDETYDMISGKQSTFVNKANESTFKFMKGDIQYNIVARAYDDGVAFQYQIIAEDGQELIFNSENTTFNVPENSETYVQPGGSNCYEKKYEKKQLSELRGDYGMTFLYKTPSDVWVMLSEARHTPQYTGLAIKADGSTVLKGVFSWDQGNTKPSTTAPFVSPWRVAVLDTAAKIANTQIFENLSDPNKIEDTSWIKPGVTNWTWLNGDGTSSGETYKRYVDFAAEMNWPYVLLDEGWNVGGRDYDRFALPDWYDDLYEYAESKGVKLWAWFHKNAYSTEERRQKFVKMMADAGIVGLKIDFFDGNRQDQIALYEEISEITAQYHIMVNYHGSNLPTGERRTWPHVLNREGVNGAEQSSPNMVHYNILPFTRNAVGPMDFTPMYSQGSVSDAGHLGTTITFESGVQCLADKPAKYTGSVAVDFFRSLPSAWDDSVVLEAYPGDYYTVARRSGNYWYVGGTTVNARTATVDLSFLGEGEHYAFIYSDGENNRTINAEIRKVTNTDVIEVPCMKDGGFGIKITVNAPTQADEIILSESELNLEVDQSATVKATLNPSNVDYSSIKWTSSDDSIASVNGGVITTKKEGTVTITATTGLADDVTASCVVHVVKKAYVQTSQWSFRNEFKTAYAINGADSMTIWPQNGESYGTGYTARNTMLTNPNSNDFVVTTKLNFAPSANYETAGLIAYAGDNELFTVVRRYHSGLGGKVVGILNKNEQTNTYEKATKEAHPEQDIYLKLEKAGNQLTGSYSYDNENWIVVDKTQTNNTLNVADVKVGLYAASGGSASSSTALGNPATFTEFKVNGEAVPFAYANSYETELNITDKVITDAPAETSAEAYKAMFDTTAPMSITDKDGNELADDALVGTGCIVTVGTDVLTVVVPGDVNGDGRIGVMDLLTMKRGILGKIELADANAMAADRHADGVINIFDLVQLKLDILKG